jgi:hypothetical protein
MGARGTPAPALNLPPQAGEGMNTNFEGIVKGQLA